MVTYSASSNRKQPLIPPYWLSQSIGHPAIAVLSWLSLAALAKRYRPVWHPYEVGKKLLLAELPAVAALHRRLNVHAPDKGECVLACTDMPLRLSGGNIKALEISWLEVHGLWLIFCFSGGSPTKILRIKDRFMNFGAFPVNLLNTHIFAAFHPCSNGSSARG